MQSLNTKGFNNQENNKNINNNMYYISWQY